MLTSDGGSFALRSLQGLRRLCVTGFMSQFVRFKGNLFFEDMISVLEGALIFTNPIPERDKRRIVGDASFEAGRDSPV